MSSLAINPSATQPTNEPVNNTRVISHNEFWKARATQHGLFQMTTAQTQILALRFLSFIGFAAAATFISLAVFKIVALPIALISIPFLIFSGITIYQSCKIDDYEDVEQLNKFRETAARVSLEETGSKHGWDKVIRFNLLNPTQLISKFREATQSKELNRVISLYEKIFVYVRGTPYTLPSLREFSSKWRTETEHKSLEQIFNDYSLDKLANYSIVETGEIQLLRQLQGLYNRAYATRQQERNIVEENFQRTIFPFKTAQENAFCSAETEYNNHWAVRALHTLEVRHLRETLEISTQKSSRLRDAQTQFEYQVSLLTRNGQMSYEQLPAEDKARYNCYREEKERSCRRIERESAENLRRVNLNFFGERGNLQLQVAEIRNRRDCLKRTAQATFDAQTAPSRGIRDAALAPIDQRFRRIVNDLQVTYRDSIRRRA